MVNRETSTRILVHLVFLLSTICISQPASAQEQIFALYGDPVEVSGQLSLFGTTYTVVGLHKENDPPGTDHTTYLPFKGDIGFGDFFTLSQNRLVTDENLARAIYKLIAVNSNPQTRLQKTSDFIRQVRDHNDPAAWWDSTPPQPVTLPGLQQTVTLTPKRKIDRAIAGNGAWSGAEESGSIKLTTMFTGLSGANKATASGTTGVLQSLHESAKLRPESVSNNEIQALFLAASYYGENLQTLQSLLTARSMPGPEAWTLTGKMLQTGFDPFIRYLPSPFTDSQATQTALKTALRTSYNDRSVDLAYDSAKAALARITGFTTLEEESMQFSFLHDAHGDAINRVGTELLGIIDKIHILATGPDSNQARHAIASLSDRYIGLYTKLFMPLATELFAVQLTHIHKIQENMPGPVFAKSQGPLSSGAIDELARSYNTSANATNKLAAVYEDYLVKTFVSSHQYALALSSTMARETNMLLNVAVARGENQLLVPGRTTSVSLELTNNYSSPLTNLSVAAGTNSDQVSWDALHNVSIPAGKTITVALPVTLSTTWLNEQNCQTRSTEIVPTLNWQINSKSFAGIFTAAFTITSEHRFVTATAEKSIYLPGETARITFTTTDGFPKGKDWTLVTYLLRSNGTLSAPLRTPILTGTDAVLEFIVPADAYGPLGLQVTALYANSSCLIPLSTIPKALYIAPVPPDNLDILNIDNTLIVYPETDIEAAMDVVTLLGLTTDKLVKVEDYTLEELQGLAALSDTVLLGGYRANPLVQQLVREKKLTYALNSPGEVTVRMIERAFTSQNTLIIAGYTLRDTLLSCVGLGYHWALGVNASAAAMIIAATGSVEQGDSVDLKLFIPVNLKTGYRPTWTASRTGTFSAPNASTTTYTPQEPGIHIITVAVNNGTTFFRLAFQLNVYEVRIPAPWDGSSADTVIDTPYTLTSDETWKGNIFITTGGTVDINGYQLTVTGNLTISGSCGLQMNSSRDIVDVRGNVVFGGTRTDCSGTQMNNGVLKVGGNFAQVGKSSSFCGDSDNKLSFYASGSHTVVLNGTGPQIISFDFPDTSYSRFHNLEIANTSSQGVTFATNAYITGDLRHVSGALTGSEKIVPLASITGSWPGDLTISASNWTLTSDVAITGNLYIQGGMLSLAGHSLGIIGNTTISAGVLDVDTGSLIINGNLTLSGSGGLQMNNAGDIVDVRGHVVFGGTRTDCSGAQMNSGVLTVSGNFAQVGKSSSFCGEDDNKLSFYAQGSHTVVLNGSAPQTVSFDFPGVSYSRFQNLKIANTSVRGVIFATDIYVAGDM